MESSFIALTREEQEDLLHAIESSIQVKKRHQFFLWTQGPLSLFVPHTVLVCLMTSEGKESVVVDRFSSVVVEKDMFDEICDPGEGLVPRVVQTWRNAGCAPLLIAPEAGGAGGHHAQFRELLDRNGLGCAAAHGSPPVAGNNVAGSFFLFGGMPETLTPRHAYFLELLLPSIHMAFMRACGTGEAVFAASESVAATTAVVRPISASKMMTEREIEILGWVQEGKSNYEIGAILQISPLTVKNHVQNILKKLDVRNRAQAVSKATAMRIIDGYAFRNTAA